jgi:hypothetical protein
MTDPLLDAINARLAEFEAARPERQQAALVEAILKFQADKATGLTTPPHPDSLTPERRAECARLTEAILAYQQRHAERQRIRSAPRSDRSAVE